MTRFIPPSAAPSGPSAGVAARVAATIAAAGVLRAGLPVSIAAGQEIIVALAVEGLADAQLRALQAAGGTAGLLLLTRRRAATLKLRLYTEHAAGLALAPDWDERKIRAIADPTEDLASPLKGPFHAERGPLPGASEAAIKLAKLAGLLPAVIVFAPGGTPPQPVICAQTIMDYEADAIAGLRLVARAPVPLEGAGACEIAAFRPAGGGPEHYAIVIGAPAPHAPVLTRLHSECFTGDLLGSLKCDCGEQLRGAIAAIAKAGGGVLLYLAQEGRGIGLINKLRAYRLQDQGFDTIEANERLGFEPDERLFGAAARMLHLLGYDTVRLLTNNPDKVEALKGAGIAVIERVAHAFPDNEHNRAYLKTKADKAGHLF